MKNKIKSLLSWRQHLLWLLSILVTVSPLPVASAVGSNTTTSVQPTSKEANLCLSFEQYRKIVNNYFKQQNISDRFNVPASSSFTKNDKGEFQGEIFLLEDFPKLKFVYSLNQFGCVANVETSLRSSTIKLSKLADEPVLKNFDKALGYYNLGLANNETQRQAIKQAGKGQGKGLLKQAIAGLFSNKPVKIAYSLYGRDYQILAYPGLFSVEIKFSVHDPLASPKYQAKAKK